VITVFEALQRASKDNRYQLTWVELAPVQFQDVIPKWFKQLNKSFVAGGPTKSQQTALANEFYRLLNIQKHVLEKQAGPSGRSMESQRAKVNLEWFADEYRRKFGAAPTPPPASESGLDELIAQRQMINGKLELLDEKLQLINYWIHGLEFFPEHTEGGSLMFQYLGNAQTSKVRLFLQVMCEDAGKMANLQSPYEFRSKYETQVGLKTVGDDGKLTKVEWTNDRFKRAVKAEAGASYGVGINGTAELEFKGLKATLNGAAWAGVVGKASGEATMTKGVGFSVKGTVEAEVGVKLSGGVNVDCGDIFLCEVSAEAFAGALARGECEITATVNGVTAKVGAEVFVGARLTGKASMTLKVQGYELVKGEATGSLTAGIGAKFGLTFQSSLFQGCNFSMEAGTTFGVGAEGSAKFTVHPDNVALALQSLYYTSYLSMLGQNKKKYAYVEYFRTLNDNHKLFMKARGIVEDQMRVVITERNRLFTEYHAWKQLDGLASFRMTGSV
jgi:hypothetical protein